MFSSIRKMLRLEWMLFKLSAIADLQVPFNIGLQFINDIGWYLLQIFTFEAIYLHVHQLGGWGLPEMRVFLGILFVVDAIQMFLFQHNFDTFSEKIVRRDLDLILLRPVSSQHFMTSQRLQCGFLLNLLMGTGWLIWSLTLLPGGFPWERFWLVFIVVPAAVSVFYATRLIFVTVALLIARADHFHELYFTFFKLGQRPDRIYSLGLRYFVLLIVPVGMIASVPTRVLVDPFDPLVFAGLIGGAVGALMVANRFWHWSLQRYIAS